MEEAEDVVNRIDLVTNVIKKDTLQTNVQVEETMMVEHLTRDRGMIMGQLGDMEITRIMRTTMLVVVAMLGVMLMEVEVMLGVVLQQIMPGEIVVPTNLQVTMVVGTLEQFLNNNRLVIGVRQVATTTTIKSRTVVGVEIERI